MDNIFEKKSTVQKLTGSFKIVGIFEDSFNILVNGLTVKINEKLKNKINIGSFVELEYLGNLDIETLGDTIFSQID